MKYIIGIDEVGRGPLAGPVVVAAVSLPKGFRLPKNLGPLRDSKKLTHAARERWFGWLKNESRLKFALARVYPATIDRLNISRAANQAALRAFTQLTAKHHVSRVRCQVFLDGGLYLGSKQAMPKNARTVIRGDERIPAVALASIVAKVTRDRFMARLAKQYPGYGFERHMGYGTRGHYLALRRLGRTPAHRASFLPR